MDLLSITHLPATLAGVLVASPMALSARRVLQRVEKASGPLSRRANIMFVVLVPIVSTVAATAAGAVLGWRMGASDAWVGGVWGSVGGVISPFMWPSVRKALRSRLSRDTPTSCEGGSDA